MMESRKQERRLADGESNPWVLRYKYKYCMIGLY